MAPISDEESNLGGNFVYCCYKGGGSKASETRLAKRIIGGADGDAFCIKAGGDIAILDRESGEQNGGDFDYRQLARRGLSVGPR